MACMLCGPIELVEHQALGFAQGLFQVLIPQATLALNTFIAAYAVWIMFKALKKGQFSLDMAIKVVGTGILLHWCLSTGEGDSPNVMNWIITPLKNSFFGFCSWIIQYCGNTFGGVEYLGGDTPTALVEAFEQCILNVLNHASTLNDASGWAKLATTLICFIAAIPFVICIAYIIFTVLGFYLCLSAIAAFSPLWIVLAFFQSTRGMSMAALKLLVAHGFELAFACFMLAFSMACLKAGLTELSQPSDASVLLLGRDMLVLITLGFLSIFGQTVATTWSAQIAGAQLPSKGVLATALGGSLMAAAALKSKPMMMAAQGSVAAVKGTVKAWSSGQEMAVNAMGEFGRQLMQGSALRERLSNFARNH